MPILMMKNKRPAANSIGGRIRLVMDVRGVNNSQMAELCRVTRQSVIHWRQDSFKRLDADHALTICDTYRINLRWLVRGVGAMEAAATS